ncbi:MAG: ComF family protein [Candidatus Zixiibacteriota bacterium]|nr:MAG: ComF family protein [candidate division Zixibacteria bacterium]
MDFVFPPLCLGCGDFTEDEDAVCESCRRTMATFNRPFCLNCLAFLPAAGSCASCGESSRPLFAGANYVAPVEDIIIQFKFKNIATPARFFAKLIRDQFAEDILRLEADVLVPVPLYYSRESFRGYNQATVFAERVAELLSLRVETGIIVRTKRRRPQSRLNHAQRVTNIRGVFEVTAQADAGRKVILVDDVVTSGSTVREAGRTLERAGYTLAGVISMAHAV